MLNKLKTTQYRAILMTKIKNQYFHFTIGPVQSFVGQARRTRDFWAGSFLLSWLSGIAMLSVKKQGGVIKFPLADKSFLDAILGETNKKTLKQGSIPNRFKAEVNGDFKPEIVIENINKAWGTLASQIYEMDIKGLELENTKTIWNRQVDNFWDMSWVIVSEESDSSALDRRKNYRSHYMTEEGGIKCSLMGDFQELSGISGVSSSDNQKRKDFWSQLEKNNKADFKENEFLCAMAFIKRRFINVFYKGKDKRFQIKLNSLTAHGWKLPKAVPSVSYFAAAPFFAEVLKDKDETIKTHLKDFVIKSSGLISLNDYGPGIKCIDELIEYKEDARGLDGNVFHEAALDNINIFSDQIKAQEVKQALRKLTHKHGQVSPFYALLMMDGDSLGKQMSDKDKQPTITTGLQKFIEGVPTIVEENNGFLIYAGGDDVLALVTLEDAMQCAYKIHNHYDKCFKNNSAKVKTSISAAIIYAHIRIPISNLIHDIHDLLDGVAKEHTGRNALAVKVCKPGGVSLTWSKKWKHALNKDKKILVINDIVNNFIDTQDKSEQFSNKFFYKIRQRFELFNQDVNLLKQDVNEFLDFGVQIMAMEYCRSNDNQDINIETAKQIVKPLLEQCIDLKTNKINVDAALLVRFLAQKGIEV